MGQIKSALKEETFRPSAGIHSRPSSESFLNFYHTIPTELSKGYRSMHGSVIHVDKNCPAEAQKAPYLYRDGTFNKLEAPFLFLQ